MSTRALQPHHLEIEPGKVFTAYPSDSFDGWGSLEEAKKPTFSRGDVVAIDTANGPRRAVVVYISRKYSEYSASWIVIYKLRLYKNDGTLGKAWRWAYPGDIERGFSALAPRVEA